MTSSAAPAALSFVSMGTGRVSAFQGGREVAFLTKKGWDWEARLRTETASTPVGTFLTLTDAKVATRRALEA